MNANSPPHSLFSQRWLAETLRVRDGNAIRAQDAQAQTFATAQSRDPEQRILLRAHYIADQDGTLDALRAWRQQARWILIILLALSFIAGFSSARAVLGDGDRPVNVIWALGGLLGVNWLMLLLWLLNLVPGVSSGERGGLPGRVWLWLSGRFGRRLPGSAGNEGKPVSMQISQALVELLNRARSMIWCFGAITHMLWLCLLGGALLGLLLSLALRSYVFIWETTILTPETFVETVSLLGWLPAQLGMDMPDAEMVRSSGVAGSLGPAFSESQQEPVRRAWASWLAAGLLLYGIVPRLLLGLWCLQMLRSRTQRLRLDTLPAYAALLARLQPNRETAGISDKAPETLYRNMMGANATPGTRAGALIGLELGQDVWSQAPWLEKAEDPAADILLIQTVETRDQRRQALSLLESNLPQRLLFVCDPRLSPDRGALNWIADASWQAGETRVLLPASLNAPARRLESWQEALRQSGLQMQQIYTDQRAALQWVRHDAG